MPLYGDPKSPLLLVSEAPGLSDDSSNRPMSGQYGTFLLEVFRESGFDLSKIAIANVLRCRTPESRSATKEEIKLCGENTELDIKSMPNLKIVVLVGSVAVQYFLGKKVSQKMVGDLIMSEDGVCYYPIVHPSRVMAGEEDADKFVTSILALKSIYDAMCTDRKIDGYRTVKTIEDMYELVAEIYEAGFTVFDIESFGLDPWHVEAKIVGTGFTTKPKHAWFIPFDHPQRQFSDEVYQEIKQYVIEILKDDSIKKIGHNLKFDALYTEVLWNFRSNNLFYDTMVGEYALDENKKYLSLKRLAVQYTDMGRYDMELDGYLQRMGISKGDMDKVELGILSRYCCADVDATIRIYLEQKPVLEQDSKHAWVFYNIMMPSVEMLKDIEKAGIAIDVDYVKFLEVDVPNRLTKLEHELQEFPESVMMLRDVEEGKVSSIKNKKLKAINFGSSVQLSTLLYDYFKLPCLKLTKTGGRSTGKKALKPLEKKHPVVKVVCDWKILRTANTKYVQLARKEWMKYDGRVHGGYFITGTKTGRLSSSKPNMQQIPRDKSIKNIFVPKKGYVYVHADYSQIELRVLAICSRDPGLMRAFHEGKDIHSFVGSQVHGMPYEEFHSKRDNDPVIKEVRRFAKVINFGLVYGMGPPALASILECTEDEARRFMDDYFNRYPAVKKYMNACIDHARKFGFVRSLIGRKRRLPEIHSYNRTIKSHAERQSFNSPIQGLASDMTLSSLILINKFIFDNNLESRLVMTVHDSIVLECPMHEVAIVKPQLIAIMENLPYAWIDVPIKADVELGSKLGELTMSDGDEVVAEITEEDDDGDDSGDVSHRNKVVAAV